MRRRSFARKVIRTHCVPPPPLFPVCTHTHTHTHDPSAHVRASTCTGIHTRPCVRIRFLSVFRFLSSARPPPPPPFVITPGLQIPYVAAEPLLIPHPTAPPHRTHTRTHAPTSAERTCACAFVRFFLAGMAGEGGVDEKPQRDENDIIRFYRIK